MAVIAVSPSASRRMVAASWLRALSGIPSGTLQPLAARSAAPLMYLAARTCIASARAVTVIPRQGRRQRNGPRRLHRAGAGPFAGDLEQHLPGRVRDDLVAEIVAGGCLGDSHEGCCRTDLPGDQLTGTLPVEVHAGRGELLREHVDLAVGSRAPGQVARLPSSRYGARLHPERPVAVTRRSSARYRHWPSRCYSRHRRDAA